MKFSLFETHIVFYIALLIPFLNMFLAPHVYMIRGGMVLSVIALLMISFNLKDVLKILRFKVLFSFFIFFEIVSLFGYFKLKSEIDTKTISFLIFSNINYLLLPQLMFFLLGVKNGINQLSIKKSINIILNLNFILILMGVILYIIKTDFYLEFLKYNFPKGFVFYGGFYPRLISFLGDSMSIGVLCSSSFILALVYSDQKWKRILYPFIFLVGDVMSMQRGAWLSLFMGTGLLMLWKRKLIFDLLRRVNKKILLSIFLVFILAIIVISFIDIKALDSFLQELGNRFGRITTAISERTSQWENVTYALEYNPLLGKGLGTLSHKAVNVGLSGTIPDGNYLRIIGETGILGGLSFLCLLGIAFLAAYKSNQKGLSIVLVIYSFQAIGNNVFDLYYASFIFWFVLGLSHSSISYLKSKKHLRLVVKTE